MNPGDLVVGQRYVCPVCGQKVRLGRYGLRGHQERTVREGTLWMTPCEGSGRQPALPGGGR